MSGQIRIGFDDVPNSDEAKQESKKGAKEFIKLNKYKPPYIPPDKISELKEQMSCVVVHDYRDAYHLSEEERTKRYELYKYFKAVDYRSVKYKHNKLESYITSMRKCMKCLQLIADNNGFYEPEEFIKLYFKNKIVIHGFKFPRLVNRKLKRSVDPKFLTEFILSDEPVNNVASLIGNDVVDVDGELLDEDISERIINKDELKEIISSSSSDVSAAVENACTYETGSDAIPGVITSIDNATSIKVTKSFPQIVDVLLDVDKSKKKKDNLNRYAMDYMFTDKDYSKLESFNRKYRNEKSDKSKLPQFSGDITNVNEYNRYLRKLEEYRDNNVYTENDYYGNKHTIAESQDTELKELLQEKGFNLREFWNNDSAEKKARRLAKKNNRDCEKWKAKLIVNSEFSNKKITNRERKRRLAEIEKKFSGKKSKKTKKKEKKGVPWEE